MLDLLSKPASEISPLDINALVIASLPEGEQVEFKRSLPVAKGKRDPWQHTGELGDRAKTEILEEVTAFANSYGGVLVLGIEETSTTPPAASAVTPIPRCADLAERFKLIFRDCVEPKLSGLEVFAIPMDKDNGVVVFRVARSRFAPHRVMKTLVCPVRRAERCEKMTMHEIQDMTMNVSKGLEKLDKRLSERSQRFYREIERLVSPENAFGCRFTALPTGYDIVAQSESTQKFIARATQLPWRTISLNGRTMRQVTCEPRLWSAILRGNRSDRRPSKLQTNEKGHLVQRKVDSNIYHEIHSDGLVEFGGLPDSTWKHQWFPPD